MNQAKIQTLLEHIQEGGDLKKETLASVLSIQARSEKAMIGYLEAVQEEDENLTDLEIGGTHFYSDAPASDEDEEEEHEEDDEEDEEEEAPAPQPKKEKKSKAKAKGGSKQYRFFFEKENGTSIELEKIDSKSGGKVVTFREKAVTDFVTAIVKGKEVEVDLVSLRLKKPSDPSDIHPEVSNESLLRILLAARP